MYFTEQACYMEFPMVLLDVVACLFMVCLNLLYLVFVYILMILISFPLNYPSSFPILFPISLPSLAFSTLVND